MARSTDLSRLASTFRSHEARRAAVALAALLDASRRFAGLPGLDAIADGSRTLEEAARALTDVGGPPLPGLVQVAAFNASRSARVSRGDDVPVSGSAQSVAAAGELNGARLPPLRGSIRVRPTRAPRDARRGAARDRRDRATLASELAGVLASMDWTGVADPAGRVLQEFRAASDRKENGAFYTPGPVVEGLLDAVTMSLDGARVLDPACGSGEFLLEAARRGAVVSGADVDAEAVAVARFRLACLAVTAHEEDGGSIGELADANLLHEERLTGPFDAVIGNPPYVRFHNMAPAERGALSRRYETAVGQFDLFAPFLEAALTRVRPGGTVAFVLPALLLRGSRYATLRRFLLARARVAAVIDHGDGAFEGVLAPTCVLVLVRHPASADRVRWTTPAGVRVDVDHTAWLRDPQCAFAPVSAAASALLARLEELPRLKQLAHLGRGVEIGRSHPALSSRPGASFVPCLTGSDVEPWRAVSTRWLDPTGLPKRLFPEERRARVLVRETGARITAVSVPEGTASTRSLFHVVANDGEELPSDFLLAWLHSSIARFWFATCVRADSGIFPKLRIGQLGDLHIPMGPSLVAAVGELAARRRRARTKAAARELDGWIDEAFATFLRLGPAERDLLDSAAR